MIELEDEAKDTVTGFKGKVIAITEWIHGCTRVTLQPKAKKDGTFVDSQTFDEPGLVVIKKGMRKKKEEDDGGPLPFEVSKPTAT